MALAAMHSASASTARWVGDGLDGNGFFLHLLPLPPIDPLDLLDRPFLWYVLPLRSLRGHDRGRHNRNDGGVNGDDGRG